MRVLTATQPLTHAAEYVLGSVGKDSSCPAGYEQADKDICGEAARSAGVAAGASTRNSGWVEGSWAHVPFGCSMVGGAIGWSGAWRPHWNTRNSGSNNGNYRVVCTQQRTLLCWGAFMVFLLYVCMVVYVCTCVWLCMHAWLCMYMYVCMYVCMYAIVINFNLTLSTFGVLHIIRH